MLWGKHPHHRKYKFIDKKQQVRFAVDVALHSLLFPIFLLILLILPPFSTILLGKIGAQAMQPILMMFYYRIASHWWVLVPALAFVAIFSVLFSHRVFGPIRRLENALNQKKSDPTKYVRCNLRGGDYFHDFANLFEEVLNLGVEKPAPPVLPNVNSPVQESKTV